MTSPAPAPAVAVLNIPGLAVTLTSAGMNVIGDGLADTKSSIEMLRTIQKNDQPFVIIAAVDDPSLRSWATLHASMGAPVLIARSELFIRGDNIPQSRIIDLPCTVNEIMANFGADLDTQYGDVEIGVDGRVVADAQQSESSGDPFNVFGTFIPQQTTQQPEVVPTTSAPSDDDVFTPPPSPVVRDTEDFSDDVFTKHAAPETTLHTAPDAIRRDDVLTPDNDIDPTGVFEAEPDLPAPTPPAPTPPARIFTPAPAPFLETESEDRTDDIFEPVVLDAEPEPELPQVIDVEPEVHTDDVFEAEIKPELPDVSGIFLDDADDDQSELPPAPTPPARIFTTPPRTPTPFLQPKPDPLAKPESSARRADIPESILNQTSPYAPTNARRAKVVAVFAGKGGVGKSTTTLSLAERAATVVPGLRVIALDANRGQGDMRTFLKLDDAGLPSIYDAAVSHNPDVFRDVLINPKRLSASRVDRTPLHVGIILSPEKDQSDPSVVTSQVYAQAIEYARTKADLVFVDTQIIESFDTSGLIDDVIVPLLLDGAWGLGLSDSSTPGVQNLMWVLNNFVERGVSTNRLMVALNKVAPDSLIDADAMAKYVERYATWMGVATIDPLIERTLNLGEMPGSSGVGATSEFTALLNRVLSHVTGINAFSQISESPPPDDSQIAPSRRFMPRWRR